jgi:HK97 family phage major capsid protein
MPFNDLITRADAGALSSEEVAQLQTELVDTSWLLRLAMRLPDMGKSQRRIPVWQNLPVAYFVDGDTGLMQTSDADWTNRYIDAETLGVIVPIPKAVLSDSDYDLWAQVRPKIVEAMDRAIAGAVLFGVTPYGQPIPASWANNMGAPGSPAAGIMAGATAAGHVLSAAAYTDLYEAILGENAAGVAGVCETIEADGFMATGHVAATVMRGRLRNVRTTGGQPIFMQSMQEAGQYVLDGAPIVFPRDGLINPATALMISGQWDKLVWAYRQDMEWEVSTEATITDGSGKTVFNLFQQNMVGLKVTLRIGFALPNPRNYANPVDATRFPFAVLTA